MKRNKQATRTTKILTAAGLILSLSLVSEPLMGGTRNFRTGRYDERTASPGHRGEPGQADRLRSIMIPLIKAMDRPCPADELQVSIVNQSEVNAGNAGGCQFLVTAGLLQRASDDQLRGVLAHEIAHQDLGHVARAQVLNTGLGIGAALLEQIFPGSGAIAPLAGTLIARGHGRTEEYAADRHGVDILRRAGYPSEIMADTLTWLRSTSGTTGGGGFLSTHPALDERIAELRKLR